MYTTFFSLLFRFLLYIFINLKAAWVAVSHDHLGFHHHQHCLHPHHHPRHPPCHHYIIILLFIILVILLVIILLIILLHSASSGRISPAPPSNLPQAVGSDQVLFWFGSDPCFGSAQVLFQSLNVFRVIFQTKVYLLWLVTTILVAETKWRLNNRKMNTQWFSVISWFFFGWFPEEIFRMSVECNLCNSNQCFLWFPRKPFILTCQGIPKDSLN